MGEKSATSDGVVGRMQLEEKWLPGSEDAEFSISSRLPKIDLIDPFDVGEKGKPLVIGYAQIEIHLNNISLKISTSLDRPYRSQIPSLNIIIIEYIPILINQFQKQVRKPIPIIRVTGRV